MMQAFPLQGMNLLQKMRMSLLQRMHVFPPHPRATRGRVLQSRGRALQTRGRALQTRGRALQTRGRTTGGVTLPL